MTVGKIAELDSSFFHCVLIPVSSLPKLPHLFPALVVLNSCLLSPNLLWSCSHAKND